MQIQTQILPTNTTSLIEPHLHPIYMSSNTNTSSDSNTTHCTIICRMPIPKTNTKLRLHDLASHSYAERKHKHSATHCTTLEPNIQVHDKWRHKHWVQKHNTNYKCTNTSVFLLPANPDPLFLHCLLHVHCILLRMTITEENIFPLQLISVSPHTSLAIQSSKCILTPKVSYHLQMTSYIHSNDQNWSFIKVDQGMQDNTLKNVYFFQL